MDEDRPGVSVFPSATQFDEFLATAFGRGRGTFAQEAVLDTLSDVERLSVPSNHKCLIYDEDVEQLAVVIPFVRDGLERGARCLYIADEHTVGGVESALQAGGVDVRGAIDTGALAIETRHHTYLQTGAFDPEDMIQYLADCLSAARRAGFSGLFITSEMAWLLGTDPGVERGMEYESKLAVFFAAHPDAVRIGQFNRRRFSAETILDVIRTHPCVGFGGVMSQNPYYVPPEEFLAAPQPAQEVGRLLASITSRYRIASELRAAGYYTRSLYDLNLEALVTTTPEGVIRDVNRAMEVLLGRERDAILGSDLSEHFADRVRTDEFLRRVLAQGTVAGYELSARGLDGTITPVALNAFALRDSSGRIRAVISSARDLSDQKRVAELQQQTLAQAGEFEQARSDFVSRVSHELRSPLTFVLGYLELLVDGDADPLSTDQRAMLAVIDRNAHRLLTLVEDLLTMSRIDAGTLEIHREEVAIQPLVERVLEGFSPTIAKRNLTCLVSIDADLRLQADAGMLEHVVENLVSNAVKFTPPGGHIEVIGKLDGDHAVISVRDTGIGIPLDEQPRLFSRFFRSSLSRKLETQGTGIGLFIVRQITNAHGGTIEVTSRPDEGTTVAVSLPLRPSRFVAIPQVPGGATAA